MKGLRIAGALACAASLCSAAPALAATTVVTPTDPSWATMDTRPGGATTFTNEFGAPAGLGVGSLKLTTDATTTAKADYFTANHSGTDLDSVSQLGYWTYQDSASFAGGAPSFQLQIDADGTPGGGGFTTLVFEPYENGTVTPDAWQQWDVDAGQFWSTRNVAPDPAGNNTGLTAGGGGAPFYTLAQVQAKYPSAIVLGVGVNIGSNNPSYVTGADGVTFNTTTYDFEPRPSSKDECKNGGWATYGSAYKNQGDCVSSFAPGKNK
jgi:hypothetical protein